MIVNRTSLRPSFSQRTSPWYTRDNLRVSQQFFARSRVASFNILPSLHQYEPITIASWHQKISSILPER